MRIARDEHAVTRSAEGDSQIIAMNACAAVMFPVSEYTAKHAVWRTQNTNIPATSMSALATGMCRS